VVNFADVRAVGSGDGPPPGRVWSVDRVGSPGDVEAEDRDAAVDQQQRFRLAVVEVGGHPRRVAAAGVLLDDETVVEHSPGENARPVDEQVLLSSRDVDGDEPPMRSISATGVVTLRKLVARELKDDLNNLAIWQLADDGWRTVLTARLERLQEEHNRALNTPKTNQITALFTDAVGIDDVADQWYWQKMESARAKEKLDEFITLRGDIAHRGSAASSVHKSAVRNYYGHVKHLVDCTERHVGAVIGSVSGQPPWL
jgi:hypothetical protein